MASLAVTVLRVTVHLIQENLSHTISVMKNSIPIHQCLAR